MSNKLYKDDQDNMIGGVCKGLSDFTGLDVSVVRLIFVLGLLGYGALLWAYIILYIILPTKTDCQ